jgi:5-oxopent-3-ene-1,2,5-tricarboxylate decarboxylase/2-hydroxyhepta-2,4-diene-1,7-dioate isomerase
MKQGRIVLNQQARRVTALADGKLLLDNGNPLADSPQWLAPASGTVYGVALNHRSLLEQLEADFQQPPYQKAPATPVLFIKPRNTHAGHGSAIALPTQAGKVFAGGALGVVLGKVASKVAVEQALAVVAGYTVVNEISLEETSFYRPAVKAKCRDGFCPMGPWQVDAAAIDQWVPRTRWRRRGPAATTPGKPTLRLIERQRVDAALIAGLFAAVEVGRVRHEARFAGVDVDLEGR